MPNAQNFAIDCMALIQAQINNDMQVSDWGHFMQQIHLRHDKDLPDETNAWKLLVNGLYDGRYNQFNILIDKTILLLENLATNKYWKKIENDPANIQQKIDDIVYLYKFMLKNFNNKYSGDVSDDPRASQLKNKIDDMKNKLNIFKNNLTPQNPILANKINFTAIDALT